MGETESIIVVRYSIGWRGRVERGREVIALSVVGFGVAGAKGFCWPLGLPRVGVAFALSEIMRVRPGKAGFRFGAGEVRRVSRICDTV